MPLSQSDNGISFINGAVEWTRTITGLPPPAPQAGASTNSATTAQTIIRLSVTAAKKKYLFTSDSLSCQQKTAISRELQVHAPAGRGLQVLPERLAGPVLRAQLARPAVQVLPVRSSGPEQTCPT